MILTPLAKLPHNVGDLGKIIVATSFEWLPKVQKITQSGHTADNPFPYVHQNFFSCYSTTCKLHTDSTRTSLFTNSGQFKKQSTIVKYDTFSGLTVEQHILHHNLLSYTFCFLVGLATSPSVFSSNTILQRGFELTAGLLP